MNACEMTVKFKLENKLANPKKDWFTISDNTATDVTKVLKGQIHNPEGDEGGGSWCNREDDKGYDGVL